MQTKKSAIAAYWLGTERGRRRLPDNAALIDLGEPSCFACGWMAADPDEDPIVWAAWDLAKLERCHLVPHALGGPDEPANLVLLCGRCHSEAPDVRDAGYMLRWIGAHASWGHRLSQEMQAAMDLAGLSEDMMETFNERLLPEGAATLRDMMSTWSIAVAGRLSYATLAACAVEAVQRVVRNQEHSA